MDNFFATNKSRKPSQGHTCCQLLVTDNGFIHVVTMKLKGEVIHEVTDFSKDIGTPEAMVCDAAGGKTS